MVAALFLGLPGCALYDSMQGDDSSSSTIDDAGQGIDTSQTEDAGPDASTSDASTPEASAPDAQDADTQVPDIQNELPANAYLEFSTQPGLSEENKAITPNVVVAIKHGDELVTDIPVDITLSLSGGDSNAILGGMRRVQTQNGRAAFYDLTVDRAGNDYQLLAQADGVGAAASERFNVVDEPPQTLVFTRHPADGIAGKPLHGESLVSGEINPAITVEFRARPDSDTPLDVNEAVILTLNDGGALKGETRVDALNGVAVFDNVIVPGPGENLKLIARADGDYQQAESKFFTIRAASADEQYSSLTIETASPHRAGDILSLKISLRDDQDEPIAEKLVEITSDEPTDSFSQTSGAFESGPHTIETDADGIAHLNIQVEKAGTHNFSASVDAIELTTSTTVDPGDPAALRFEDAPAGDIIAGDSFLVSLLIIDSFNNQTALNPTTIELSVIDEFGDPQLWGDRSSHQTGQTNNSGAITFMNLQLTSTGTYRLRASAESLFETPLYSTTFTIKPSAPDQWNPSTYQDHADVAGFAPISTGIVKDKYGNAVPGLTVKVIINGDHSSTFTIESGTPATWDGRPNYQVDGTTNEEGEFTGNLRTNHSSNTIEVELKVIRPGDSDWIASYILVFH